MTQLSYRDEFNGIVEFAIKRVPLRKRMTMIKSVRRHLEKIDHGNKDAIRYAMGADRGLKRGMTKEGIPRVIEIEGRPHILHYRGTRTSDSLRTSESMNREGIGGRSPEEIMRKHVKVASGGLSTSTRPIVARRHAYGHNSPSIGVYATSLSDLVRNQKQKTVAAMVNRMHPAEQEITQITGSNLIKERKMKAVVVPGQEDVVLRRVKSFSARDEFNSIISLSQS